MESDRAELFDKDRTFSQPCHKSYERHRDYHAWPAMYCVQVALDTKLLKEFIHKYSILSKSDTNRYTSLLFARHDQVHSQR